VSGITNWETFSYSSIPTLSNETWNAATCDFAADGYRLPTEAEWEYLARGGNNGIPATQTTYSGSNSLDTVGWYVDNSSGAAHEVKNKTKNSLDIHDMSGNVWELCWDWYSETIPNSTSSVGVSTGSDRVVRGGSWSNAATACTVATRWAAPEGFAINDCIGFRVVRTVQ
jgi:formylglycine-generating enzyme required for sulfatase activity